MTNARTPIAFVATTSPDSAQTFYRDVLGLSLTDASPYALVFADGATMLRVQIVATLTPASHTVHGWQVSDIAKEVETLTSKGVTFEIFKHMEQDSMGIWTTPQGDKIAWFKDPDGNTLSLTQFVR